MNNVNLSKLASIVSLPSEVSKATEIKNSVTNALETANAISEDMEQFLAQEPEPQPIQQEPLFQTQQVVETIEDYDAEKEARSLVYTMAAIDQFALNIAVLVKCRMSAGGGRMLSKMKTALTKEISGTELTENDKLLIAKFKEYKANLEVLSGEVMIKTDEMNRLIEVATDYCESSQIKIGSGAAFWANYFGSLAGRVTKIITR